MKPGGGSDAFEASAGPMVGRQFRLSRETNWLAPTSQDASLARGHLQNHPAARATAAPRTTSRSSRPMVPAPATTTFHRPDQQAAKTPFTACRQLGLAPALASNPAPDGRLSRYVDVFGVHQPVRVQNRRPHTSSDMVRNAGVCGGRLAAMKSCYAVLVNLISPLNSWRRIRDRGAGRRVRRLKTSQSVITGQSRRCRACADLHPAGQRSAGAARLPRGYRRPGCRAAAPLAALARGTVHAVVSPQMLLWRVRA